MYNSAEIHFPDPIIIKFAPGKMNLGTQKGSKTRKKNWRASCAVFRVENSVGVTWGGRDPGGLSADGGTAAFVFARFKGDRPHSLCADRSQTKF